MINPTRETPNQFPAPSRRQLLRATAGGVLGLAALGGLAACGGEDPAEEAEDNLEDAGDNLDDAADNLEENAEE